MIPAGAKRIAQIVAASGVVNVRFDGTKQGVCFTSMSELAEKIAWAQEINPYVQFLLQIGEHLKTDPTISASAPLTAKPFLADAAAIADMVID